MNKQFPKLTEKKHTFKLKNTNTHNETIHTNSLVIPKLMTSTLRPNMLISEKKVVELKNIDNNHNTYSEKTSISFNQNQVINNNDFIYNIFEENTEYSTENLLKINYVRTIYKEKEREKSIMKGIKYIYELSRNYKNFLSFGNDIIQCFYDISQISKGMIHYKSLDYLNICSQMWKKFIDKEGWKNSSIATIQEVIEGCILAYSFDCISVFSTLKDMIKPYVLKEINIETNLNKSQSEKIPLYNAIDLFGWDPIEECIPKDVSEMCSKCKLYSKRGSRQCNYCNKSLFILSKYRSLSNALIYLYYFQKNGFSLQVTYLDYFKWLPSLRPYQSPSVLQTYIFNDQSYLITHIIFTLSNWGQMTLDPSLLPHEYTYIREYLPYYIVFNDIHLVGEFVECLRIFGVSDNDSILIEGYDYILNQQNEDGSWDKKEDVDNYTLYHAIMVGCQALLDTHYIGNGPSIIETKNLLEQWNYQEFIEHTTIQLPIQLKYMDELNFPLINWKTDQRYNELQSIIHKLHKNISV